jgi:hypothetical protein
MYNNLRSMKSYFTFYTDHSRKVSFISVGGGGGGGGEGCFAKRNVNNYLSTVQFFDLKYLCIQNKKA